MRIKHVINNKGFTLIEVVVAAALSSIILLAFGDLFITSQAAVNNVEQEVDFDSLVSLARDALTNNVNSCNKALAGQPFPTLGAVPMGTLGSGQPVTIYYKYTPPAPAVVMLTDGQVYGEFPKVNTFMYNMGQFNSGGVTPYYLAAIYIQATRPANYFGSKNLGAVTYVSVDLDWSTPGVITNCQLTVQRNGIYGGRIGATGTNILNGAWSTSTWGGNPYSAPAPKQVDLWVGNGALTNPAAPAMVDVPGEFLPFVATPTNFNFTADPVAGTWTAVIIKQAP